VQSQVLTTKKLKQFLSTNPYSFNDDDDDVDSEKSVNETSSNLSNSSVVSGIYNFGI
jgi:hypothetical protein